MNTLIFSKNRPKVKSIIVFFLVIAVFCVQEESHPKHWEYAETTTGTIRRVPQRKWSIVSRVVFHLCVWSLRLAFVLAVFDGLGLWGVHLLWLAVALACKPILSICPNCFWLHKTQIKTCVHLVLVALLGNFLLSSCFTPDASTSTCNLMLAPVLSVVASQYVLETPPPKLVRSRYKLSMEDQQLLYHKLCENREITSPALLSQFPHLEIRVGQINRVRNEWGLSRRQGRPDKNADSKEERSRLQAFQHLPKAGAKFFSIWLGQQTELQEVLQAIYLHVERYKKEYPNEDFRLLHTSKHTIAKKWMALVMLPSLGIQKLTELDYCQHDMDRVLGYSYKASTLIQFLGDLERIAVGGTLKSTLAGAAEGQFCYIDGHMIALWSRVKMHKGRITMLGRIMPGSKCVIAHDQSGQAIGFDYCPPDTHLSHIVEDYCREIVALTGIRNFIIDREVNSVNTACLFSRNGWGLICLLDANEYKGLESFNKKFSKRLDDGTIFYKAVWETEREDDPRRFVVVKESQRCLVYWSTRDIAQKFTAEEIVAAYRNRTEIQENGIKRMISHGALNTNYGTKKIWGKDRTYERKIAGFDQRLEKLGVKERKISEQIVGQYSKIRDSIDKGHDKRLEARFAKFNLMIQQKDGILADIQIVRQEKEKLGEPGLRADRDFRKQTIMTFRTLWVENMLQKFTHLVAGNLRFPVDIDIVLELFFLHRGMLVETAEEILYLIDSRDLSQKYQGILEQIVAGANQISLAHRGKRITLKLIGFT